MDDSDPVFGDPQLTYPSEGGTTLHRGAIAEPTDALHISADRRTLEITLFAGASGRVDQVRVLLELPRELQDFSRRVRRGLVRLEHRIETAQRGARRRFTRLLREVSHQLGRLEAEGERRWKQQTYPARREAVKLLKRLEKAIEPPRSRPARKKKAAATRARPTTV